MSRNPYEIAKALELNGLRPTQMLEAQLDNAILTRVLKDN